MSYFGRGVLATLTLIVSNVLADEPTINEKSQILSEQRYHYELAKSALKKKDRAAFEEYYAALGDYPLKIYLDYAQASDHLYPLKKPEVEAFILKHRGSYLGERLHRQYLHTLAKRESWSDLIYWYTDELANTSLRCQWLQARLETGDTTALNDVADVWVSPKSLPKQCDPLFALWQQSDLFTQDVIWTRYVGAMKHRQRGLARYVGTLLDEDYADYRDMMSALDQRPHEITRHSRYERHTPEMQEVIAFGIQKYARHAPQKAWNHWERYEATRIFDEQLVVETKLELIKRLLRADHIDDVQQILAASPSVRDAGTIEQLIRELLRQQRWQDVQTAIALLPTEDQQSDRWQYWAARTADELRNDGTAADLAPYRSLAGKRSFYGFLSADLLSQPYTLQEEHVEFDAELLATLARKPALARAHELWLTGHMSEAYAEWFYGLNRLSATELAAAGVLASEWGWHDRAIHAMIAGQHWNHLDVRFPLAYKEHIFSAAEKTALDPSFIFAIARQESAMSEAARSSAGARGLMQLMPATAKQTAQKAGIPHRTDDLYHAEHNITLGSHYLNELLAKYQGNRILAAAAYNAGPHRVSRWVSADSSLPFDVWIETIPFRETRGYVQNVLTFSVIYSFRMGQPSALIRPDEANRKL